MENIRLVLFISFFALTGVVSGQSIASVGRPIGRDVKLQMINYKVGNARISDFKDKLLIIDFWATWCDPCRSFLLTADSLQKEFGDKIIILPVTYEDSLKAVRFLNDFKLATGINVTSVINDQSLNQMFPHNLIPHEVWINPVDQKVIAITDNYQVNAANIDRVLHSEQVQWQMKDDIPSLEINVKKPVLIKNAQVPNLSKSIVLRDVDNNSYQFILTGHISGIASQAYLGDPHSLKVFNNPIPYLYTIANYDEDDPGSINSKRMIIQVKDTSATNFPESGNYQVKKAWMAKNDYCFELILKDTTLDRGEIARKELNNYFKTINITGNPVTKAVPCYLLRRTSAIDKLSSKGGEQKESVHNPYQMSLQNEPLGDWIFVLQTYWLQLGPPVYDESGFGEIPVDMNLTCNMKRIDSINKALEKYDLQFVKSEKKIRTVEIKNVQPETVHSQLKLNKTNDE
jgi:thiol-disulfide isomerase/thioredoxin